MTSCVLERFKALHLAIAKEKIIPRDPITLSLFLQYN